MLKSTSHKTLLSSSFLS